MDRFTLGRFDDLQDSGVTGMITKGRASIPIDAPACTASVNKGMSLALTAISGISACCACSPFEMSFIYHWIMVAAGMDYKYRKKGIWCAMGGKKDMLKLTLLIW